MLLSLLEIATPNLHICLASFSKLKIQASSLLYLAVSQKFWSDTKPAPKKQASSLQISKDRQEFGRSVA